MNSLYIARSSEIACRKLEDETIIMSVRDSTLFTLNESATAIWEAADGKTPLEEIVEHTICRTYEIDRDIALQDALELVHRLAKGGLLRLADSPFNACATQGYP
jgi:Coenzyme PQQ synthesis protein D (PqqD)